MFEPRINRRLAAILAADVVGYSRLVQQDEVRTLTSLRRLKDELIGPLIARHMGRTFKTMGDGLLAEFPSVVDATACAVEIQQAISSQPSEIKLRIGINLGDVIIEGDDLLGDGVNVASRLEGIAPPGGIAVSDTVRDHLGNRINLAFEDMGEQQLKNIDKPVRSWRIVIGADQSNVPQPVKPAKAISRPSIAVLPFTNMSGDREQEFFADGLTEDIITELSRFKNLFVIARNSTFVYKGKPVKIQDVARDLNVHYVVEGSVRKAASRVRINVQLIDAESGQHIWAERYDRELEDIFAIQDELTSAIVSVLPGRVEEARRERASNKPTENMAAYEYLLTGKVLHHRSEREASIEALRMLEKAIELDFKYAHAHAWRACVLGQQWVNNWGEQTDLLREITREAKIALGLDDNDADVHRLAAAIAIITNDLQSARYHQQKALSLNPSYDLVVVQQGELLTWLGDAEEGVKWIRRAMMLNPFHPDRFWAHLGRAYFTARQYPKAIECYHHLNEPGAEQLAWLAASYAGAGDQENAAASAEKVRAKSKNYSAQDLLLTLHYKNKPDADHLRELLLRAGLPA